MDIKITTLAENTATQSCIAEWGLSMLVEADGKTILFDTGLGTAAMTNAITLGVDFSRIDQPLQTFLPILDSRNLVYEEASHKGLRREKR